MKKARRRTIGHSFRVYEDLLKMLNEEAEAEGISPNALLNRILQDYSMFGRYKNRFPCTILGEELFANFIMKISREQAAEIGKAAGLRTTEDFLRTVGLIVDSMVDYDDVLYLLERVLGNYARWFIYNRSIIKGNEVFYLRHNYGRSWSVFLAESLSPMFEKIINKKPKIDILEDSVTFEIALTRARI